MPRLGLGMPLTAGLSQEAVTIIDDFFFESDTSGEVTPIYTASRKQFARNNNDVVLTSAVTKDTSITVPPGQTGTAIRVIETTANSQHYATTVIDEVTAGDTYTMSLYVKSTYSQIIIYTNTTQISSNVTVNFTNKTIATSALRAGIEDAGGGWYRVNWTQVAQASGSSKIYLVVKDLSSYTGSTSNFTDYFGMQVEQDSRASSFMLNTTSDVLTVSTTLNDTSEVWDFDSTDIMLEADPEDEGFWEEGSNIVLNGDYEELGSELVTNGDFDQIGSEQITNGDFSNGENNWSFGTGWSIVNGKATVVNQTDWLTTTGTPILANKQIKLQFDVVLNGGTLRVKNNTNDFDETFNTVGSYTITRYYSTGGSASNLQFPNYGSGFSGSIDNVSVKEVGQGFSFLNAELTDSAVVLGQADGSISQVGQEGILTIGKAYKLSYEILEDNGGSFSLSAPLTTLTTTVGSHEMHFTATSTDLFIKRSSSSTTTKTTFTNISVKQVDPNDRWSLAGDWEISNGSLNIDSASIANAKHNGLFTVGDTYEMNFDLSISSGYVRVYFGTSANTIQQQITSSGNYTIRAVAENTPLTFRNGTNTNCSIDNVTIREYAIQPQDV